MRRGKNTSAKENFGANLRLCRGGPLKRGGDLNYAPSPSSVGFPVATALGPFSSRGWHSERRRRLTQIFKCLERGRVRGKRLHKILVIEARRFRGRHYKSDPARPIRFAFPTLQRLYYEWRADGPEALTLRYWRNNRKVSVGQVIRVSNLCLGPETRSFSAAYRKLRAPRATESGYRYAIPAGLRAALAAVFAHRRHSQVLERVARQFLEGLQQ